MKYYEVLKAYLILSIKIYGQNRQNTNKLLTQLKNIDETTDAQWSPELSKKIHAYTIQACMVGSWTSTLRGYKLSNAEKRNAAYLGAITPIVDDLTDKLKLTSPEIFDILRTTHKAVEGEMLVARTLYGYLQAIENPLFHELIEQTLLSQDASISQIEERSLSIQQLKEITSKKGGFATFLYRSVFSNTPSKEEKDAFLTLGYALQMVNDMFDIYKDYQNNQQTLFTNASDLREIASEFYATLERMKALFLKLNYPLKHIKKSLLEISTVTSRGMVCLEQLLHLQGETVPFEWKKYTRNELVCDMEKPFNIYKSVMYSVRFHKSLTARK